MMHIFFALSTVYIGHRLFTLLEPEPDGFLHFFIELTFVFWVLAGLFTQYWYLFLLLIVFGQLSMFIEKYTVPRYYRRLLRISCLVDILILTILTILTI